MTHRIFYLCCGMWDLLPWPGIELDTMHWERRVLAAGPPGKSLFSMSAHKVSPGASAPSSTCICIRGWTTGNGNGLGRVPCMSCPCSPLTDDRGLQTLQFPHPWWGHLGVTYSAPEGLCQHYPSRDVAWHSCPCLSSSPSQACFSTLRDTS